MTQDSAPDYILLADYLAGQADDAALEQWLAQRPAEAAAVRKARSDWEGVRRPSHPPMDVQVLANRVTSAIRTPSAQASRASARRRPRTRWARRVMVTTAGFITVGVAATLLMVTSRSNGEDPRIERQYETTTGQHATIDLPDGSQVTLAPQTALQYAKTSDGHRTLRLTGQAFFRVTHTASSPFIIQTGIVTTRVLGTEFDIRKYTTDSVVQVAVVSGKVMSEGETASVILTPGTVGYVTDSTTSSTTGNAEFIAEWRNGQLRFQNTPVPVMLQTLGRWYGYRFRLADSVLARRHVSTTLVVTRRAETMLALQELLDVTLTTQDSIVILSPRVKSAPQRRTPIHHQTLEAGR